MADEDRAHWFVLPLEAEGAAKQLESIKHLLWHGNTPEPTPFWRSLTSTIHDDIYATA
jgi:hypothetical protein